MRKLKFVALVLMTSFLMGKSDVAYASDNEVNITNECSELSDTQARQLYEKIEANIMQRYGEGYEFGTFDVRFEEEALTDDSYIVDVDVYADMTLVDDPSESAYAVEMLEAVSTVDDVDMKVYVQQKTETEIEKLMENYQLTQLTGFSYRIVINLVALEQENINAIELYHRVDITEENVILAPILGDESPTTPRSAENTINDLFEMKPMVYSLSSVTYDSDAAVDYAVEHACDTPEFSSKNGNGSDCANFVSYCLNAGGIPIDDEGDWHPRYEGDTWAGINWMRTGYYNNGGVTTYMEDKGYFSPTKDFDDATLGSIVYWNKTSHVALVTYIDQNGTIKYTQHSSGPQKVVYHTLPSSLKVTFFVPEI